MTRTWNRARDRGAIPQAFWTKQKRCGGRFFRSFDEAWGFLLSSVVWGAESTPALRLDGISCHHGENPPDGLGEQSRGDQNFSDFRADFPAGLGKLANDQVPFGAEQPIKSP